MARAETLKGPQLIRDVMTADPVCLTTESTIQDAAMRMKALDVGDVIVCDEKGAISGIATDRDIIVRAIAEGRGLDTKLGEVCSTDLTAVAPDTPIDKAVELMRERAIRRLPVVDDGKPAGVVSIGDLAQVRDPSSALADISAAPAND